MHQADTDIDIQWNLSNKDTLGLFSPYYRGSSNSEVLDTLQYCTGTQIGVLTIEVPIS